MKKKEAHMMKRRREYFQKGYLKCHQSKTASLERCSLSLALSNQRKVEKQLHETSTLSSLWVTLGSL